ncbi:MAG: 3-hydroxyacyl-CoA dehydrogenase NAD-binding domain-containing protein [Pseudomonadota bacterium]
MTIFHYDVDADGVATIAWDLPGANMNVMNAEGFAELEAAFDKAFADDAVKGVVLTSKKKDFAGGMDLNVLGQAKAEAEASGLNPAEGLFNMIQDTHRMMRKIELAGMDFKTKKGGKPIAWASPGTAAGIGLELGLICHRRFAADNPKAKIGLPEIMVGIFPGAGGTTRLIRMLGVMGASQFLVEGKMMEPKKAKANGLIDEVVPADELLAKAKEWVLNATEADCVKPWDAKGYKMPGGAPYTPSGYQMMAGGVAMIHGRTQGAYPAPKALMSAIYEGACVDFDTALRIEARWFTSILMNPSSGAMIRSLFLNKEALEKGAVRPKDVPDMSVKKVGVLGAGLMGAGIAYVSARAGIEVVLMDRDQEAADAGLAKIAAILDGGVKRKKITEEGKAEVLARVTATPDYEALKGADLVVEAVFEDPKIKADVTKLAEAQLGPEAIFATNTSTLPISDLAEASRDQNRFIGIHFFSPVDKMMLVEIIKGKNTGPEAVAKALDFVRQIKKTPIVVNDARFFYANRCIIPYGGEANRMIAEGIEPALVENAAKQLGFPLGPIQLGDETAVDLAEKIMRATKEALGKDYPESNGDDVVQHLFDLGRLGRKTNAGYYDYDEKGKRTGLWRGIHDKFPLADEQPDVTEVKHRLMLAQVLEAVKALEEGVLEDIREGDVGAILGWGFAPWSGGPFAWLDIMGADKVVAICDSLAQKHGERFNAPALLRDVADKGETFYGRFGPEAKAAA